MTTLAGKTILITGASRGIGQAIGLRCAKEKANIIILAKHDLNANTTTNIYLAADQISDAGGSALALNVDVRDTEAVTSAVNEAVTQFGGIDVLINNVSAFCFADTLHTTPAQFDSLMAVNVRTTFLLSQICFPHLKNALNPHIINISPPLDMEPQWFTKHLPFTMSKYGMSMCTLGLAAEFAAAKIAVNSLWPLTTIATTTIKDHFSPEVYEGSRWPTIMADAVYEIVKKKASECTGKFLIDETVLREAGVTDFSNYAVDPNSPLIQDLFIPNEVIDNNHVHVALGKEQYK